MILFSIAENKACMALRKAGYIIIGYDFEMKMNALMKKNGNKETKYYVETWQQAVEALL